MVSAFPASQSSEFYTLLPAVGVRPPLTHSKCPLHPFKLRSGAPDSSGFGDQAHAPSSIPLTTAGQQSSLISLIQQAVIECLLCASSRPDAAKMNHLQPSPCEHTALSLIDHLIYSPVLFPALPVVSRTWWRWSGKGSYTGLFLVPSLPAFPVHMCACVCAQDLAGGHT